MTDSTRADAVAGAMARAKLSKDDAKDVLVSPTVYAAFMQAFDDRAILAEEVERLRAMLRDALATLVDAGEVLDDTAIDRVFDALLPYWHERHPDQIDTPPASAAGDRAERA